MTRCGGLGVRRREWLAAAVMAVASGLCLPPAQAAGRCVRITLDGNVKAGQEWNARIGQGWVFRIMPIAPARAGSSGWDMVVDRERPAGFPDALLLATMPYGSLNEREVGTTFGLRSQDAIGWNPRSFHFLTEAPAFQEAQGLFRSLMENGRLQGGTAPAGKDTALKRLLAMQAGAGTGEFRIVDARIVSGIADPAPYAQAWAITSSMTPHTIEAVEQGRASALGSIESIRFTLTLWLPQRWVVPPGIRVYKAGCPD